MTHQQHYLTLANDCARFAVDFEGRARDAKIAGRIRRARGLGLMASDERAAEAEYREMAADLGEGGGVMAGIVQTGEAYILRTCAADMTSHDGDFQWPPEGRVSAPDWAATGDCGQGLHGFLWGEGDGGLADWAPNAVWLVAKVGQWIDLRGKVKFPEAEVVFAGSREDATAHIIAMGANGSVVGSTLTGGYRSTLTGGDGSTLTGGGRSTLTGGYRSTLTGGDRSTLTGGVGSTLTGGDGSTLTGGDGSTLTGGDGSTLTAGYRSTLTAGDGSTLTGGGRSTLTAGYRSTLTGGYRSTLTGGDGSTLTGGDGSTLTGGGRSTLTAGYRSTLTGGDGSTLTGGDGSTLTGGDGSTLIARWWDGDEQRYRIAAGECGGGLKPGIAYRVIAGKFEEVA